MPLHTTHNIAVSRAEAHARALDRHIGKLWRRIMASLKDKTFGHVALVMDVSKAWYQLVIILQIRLTKLAQKHYRLAAHQAVKKMSRAQMVRFVGSRLHEDTSLEKLVMDTVFPAQTLDQILSLVFRTTGGVSWWERLTAATKLASPHLIAGTVSIGLSQGRTPQEIAKELLPYVNNVRSTARRIARTETIRVAHETAFDAWQQLGDEIIGYQIHAQLDENTRPWHRKRSGTIYYKNPGRGQKGLHQLPRPPMEAPDPGERPAGTPQTAWNCRCFLEPVLRD